MTAVMMVVAIAMTGTIAITAATGKSSTVLS
jgi:hypothetical protein